MVGYSWPITKTLKTCKDCQEFKKHNTKYGLHPAKDAETVTSWHTVCVDLIVIVTYTILAKVRQTYNLILMKELQLYCTTSIELETGWFEISEVPIIYQYSARISQISNEVWLSIYPRPRKVIFDNGSEFKRKFIPLLEYFPVKPTCTAVKNPQ